MSEQSINEELLEIIKALTNKIENLERTVYHSDNILMKSGFVTTETPVPVVDNMASSVAVNVDNMDWKDIHKMVEGMKGGQ